MIVVFKDHQTRVGNVLLHLLAHPEGRFSIILPPDQQSGRLDARQQRRQILVDDLHEGLFHFVVQGFVIGGAVFVLQGFQALFGETVRRCSGRAV